MKKNFVTIFINNNDYDLAKDVGMIPYTLEKKFGYKAKLVCKEMNCRREYLDVVEGLEIVQLKSKRIIWNVTKYIWHEGSDIDILNLYHFDLENLLWMLTYKLKNKSGKIYLKLDMDYDGLERYKKNILIKKWAKSSVVKLADYVSAESSDIQKKFQAIIGRKKIYYIPDGYNCERSNEHFDKDDTIITVGRLGTEQKATEVLLDAFAMSCQKHDWNLKLIGEMTEECRQKITDMKKCNPMLDQRIAYLGYIADRKTLYNEYSKSKIFVLPSRWESFGLVLVEACACNCYLITTDKVPSAFDIIKDVSIGEIVEVDNVVALADAITNAIDNNAELNKSSDREKIVSTFDWFNICKLIDEMFKER